MPIFLPFLVLFLYVSPARAATLPVHEFGQSLLAAEVDRRICDNVRYRMGIPKIDPLATTMMLDCRQRFSRLTDPRPPYTWVESHEEAVAICERYVNRASFDGTSDFLTIVETRELEECVEIELSR